MLGNLIGVLFDGLGGFTAHEQVAGLTHGFLHGCRVRRRACWFLGSRWGAQGNQ